MGAFMLLFLLISLSSLWSVCKGEDTIRPGSSIRGNQTIISGSGNFATGFFSPGNSTKSYLGIWYNDIPLKTVVWVANGGSPLDSSGVLTLTHDGNLVVFDETRIAWSSGTTLAPSSMNNTRAVLKDSGNLALISDGTILWQSFDHPSDTLLADMKILYNRRTGERRYLTSWSGPDDPRPGKFTAGLDTTGPLDIVIWKDQRTYHRVGEIYSSFTATIVRSFGAYYAVFTSDSEEVYYTFSVTGSAVKIRGTLSPTGQVQALKWEENSRNWVSYWTIPTLPCDVYGRCGPYSNCQNNDAPDLCKCLTGFKPKFQDEWNKREWRNGCVREQALGCGTEVDGFTKIANVKLPDHSHSQGNLTAQDCESKCRQNCSCTAYSYGNETQISEGSPMKCLNWFGDLVDIVSNEPKKDKQLYVRIHEEKQAAAGKFTPKKRPHLVMLMAILSTGLFAIVSACYFLWRTSFAKRERAERGDGLTRTISRAISVKSGENDKEIVTFSYRRMMDATNNFCGENQLGKGGFGPVYKGILDDQEVAIKRLSKKSGQGTVEFMNEVKLIANLQHTNLVRLLGCCVERDEKILVYEYLPNRSLDKILFDPTKKANFDWSKRFYIVEGIAQGLQYLHKYSRLKVIHRDLKASNILLDAEMNPKISDFGMARMFVLNQTEANTNRIVGTYGYMAPEYALYGQFSEKSDVYSFGVLLLEIVSSRRCTDFQYHEFYPTLLGWAWGRWNEGRGAELIDQSIRDQCNHNVVIKCIHVGLLCIQESPSDRPTMPSVVLMLSNDSASLPCPKEPAFCTRTNPTIVASSNCTSSSLSNNEMTISDQVAR